MAQTRYPATGSPTAQIANAVGAPITVSSSATAARGMATHSTEAGQGHSAS